MSTVHRRIEGLSPEKLALLTKKFRQQQREGAPPVVTIPARTDRQKFPLSFAQQRLWFLNQLEQNSGFYNIGAAVRLTGKIEESILEQALNSVVVRHEVLRAKFTPRDGYPVQEIRPPEPFSIPVVDLSSLGEEDQNKEILSRARREIARPFALGVDLLVRATLYRERADRHVLLLVVHHIVADGWSMGILVRELVEVYQSLAAGKPVTLPGLSLQYADYASWQQQWLEGAAAKEALAKWTAALDGMPQVLEFPLDYQRPPVQTFNGGQVRFRIPRHVAERVKSIAREEAATPFMAFLAAFDLFLSRITGQEEFGVGIPVAQRNNAQLEGLIGFFVNTMVIRTSLKGNPSYREMIRRVRDRALAAYDNQDIPFEKIVDAMDHRRDISHSPLFQVMFDLQRSPLGSLTLPGLTVEPLELEIQTSKTDLLLMLEEEGDSIAGYFEYNSDLFSRDSIQAWVEVFGTLIEDIVGRPDHPVSELAVLPARQRELLLNRWNDTRTEIPQKPLAGLFEEQVVRTPEAIAVEFEGVRWTYTELNRKSNRIARHLRSCGVTCDTLVGLYAERSAEMIAAILGIIKAGGAYVPMDTDFPKERLAFIATDARLGVILTQERFRHQLPETGANVICIDVDIPTPAGGDDENLTVETTLDNLAYVVYTSGSTGIPKGVSISQRGVVRLVFNTNYVAIQPTDRIAQASTATFDAATFEIWGAFLHGAMLVGVPRDAALSATRISSMIQAGRINTMFVTTALFHHIATEMPDAYLGLRTLLVGGEALDPRVCRAVLAGGPPDRLINSYGPTESTTFAAWHPVRSLEANARSVPIGVPISNTTLYVLDQNFRPVPIGIVGELFIGGAGLAREYLNRPALTAEKFLPDPFSGREGDRLYRTGDLVRMLPDGSIEFIGRRDFQVKIRGFRIEPGEIEIVIARHPDVRESIVVAREDVPGEKRLVAYFVPRDGTSLEMESLQTYLRETLPGYMVPSAFVSLPEFPLNANGKVDRKLLPPPEDAQVKRAATSPPPTTPLEKFFAEQWKEILGIESVGVHDNFFFLGGDSMKGAVLINRLQKAFGATAPVSAIFLAPTIAELAMYMTVYFPEAIKKRFDVESSAVERYKENISNGMTEHRVSAETFTEFRSLIPALGPRKESVSASPKNRRAVFVLSPPRTGSTLFRVMLAGHPRLFAPPELELLSFNTLRERKEALSDTYSLWLEATVRALMEVEQCDAARAQAIMEKCEAEELSIKDFYRFLQDRLEDRLLVDKTPSYPLDPAILRRAEEDFEEPLFIHLTRHPYAMVYSFIEAKLDRNFFRYKHPFTRRQLGELIWTESNRNILGFLAGIPPRRQYRLKFEEMLREPVAQMRRLAEFLGIEYDPRLVEPYKGERMTDGVSSRSQMVGDFKFYLRKSIDQRSVDRWQIFHSEDFLSDESWSIAETLGYERSDSANGAAAGKQTSRIRTELTDIPKIPRDGPLALSSAQIRLWFLEQLEPGTPLYNIPAAVRLQGKMNAEALGRALSEIVRRHETLRTTFRADDGKPVQIVQKDAPIVLPLTVVTPAPGETLEQAAIRMVREEARLPFDFWEGPLFRARLFRLGGEDHVLALTMHHIVSDGWSVGIFVRELVDLYTSFSTGVPSKLPELQVQFADYAAWQKEWMQKDGLSRQLEYWKVQLAGATTVLELPTDRPRPAVQTMNGARESFRIGPEEQKELQAVGSGEGATPFMTLLGVFVTLLHRYTGQTDICVGTPVANRTRAEIEPLIGFFVNTLVLRADVSGNPTFLALLDRIRDMCEESFDNQEAPFEKVVDAVQPGRDLSRSALFQVMFSYVRSGMHEARIPGVTIQAMQVESGTSKFELTLEVTETQQGLKCVFEYNTDLFERSTIRRMILHFRNLLREALLHPDRPISRQSMLLHEEESLLLREWNSESADFPDRQTFGELFELQAARTPDAPAVEYLGQVLTYDQLNRRANQLARALRQSGVGAESLVGLCMDRSLEMVVGLLGIMKAGGAYVALDPAYPRDRLQMIVEDSKMNVVLTLESNAASVPPGARTVIVLDRDGPAISAEDDSNLKPCAGPQNLAYLIYTSGSTGRPKAVMIQHRSVVNLWMGLQRVVYADHAGRPLRTSLNAPLIFDASVQELVTLLSGHCLCIIPQEIRGDGPGLVSFIRESKLDVVDCVPSQLKLMIRAGLISGKEHWLPRVLLPGGEAIDEATWQTLASTALTDSYNMYGPTECTVDSTICRFRDVPGQVSIGRPIVNVRHYVLDTELQPVSIGVAGELFISGEDLARGYYDRPELTAERFLPNPFAERPGERMYRTGDRVRYMPDGNLVYIERLDHQVKVRGFRIELGEIEAALEKHPMVRQAVVVAQEETEGEKRLAAYYIPSGEDDPSAGDLRRHLKTLLPDHMIPLFFVRMQNFPTTPNGKLDRRALPKPEPVKLLSGIDAIAPRSPSEEILAGIWKEILRIPDVGIRDNFFELGGDSILSIQAIARANMAGLRLTPKQLFQNPTIEALAAVAVTESRVHAEQGTVVGVVTLTPVQRRFFEEIREDRHHWNQAVLLGIEGSLDGDIMREVVRRTMEHHDALRMRFRQNGKEWEEWNESPGGEIPYEEVDLTNEPDAQRRLREHAETVQGTLDIQHGPLLRVVRYLVAGGDRLLIVIHHLVVDGVSWRILLEDMQRLYSFLRRKAPGEFPPKTTSYREWATRLEHFVRTGALRDEFQYWQEELGNQTEPVPVDFNGGGNTEESAARVGMEFSEDETARLTGEAGKAYNTKVPELLLTALLRAYGRWAGRRVLTVEMEGHGREEFQDGIDVTRTVGWFTTLYPVILDLRGAVGPGEELKAVKEQIRRVPRNGFGYGLLRYLAEDRSVQKTMRSLARAEISFNYLGQFERSDSADGFRVIGETVGNERGGRSQRSHLLALSAKVIGGKLQVDVSYSRNFHRAETAETFLENWTEEIHHVISHCLGKEKGEYTPSDFTDAGLSEAELKGMIQELDGNLQDE